MQTTLILLCVLIAMVSLVIGDSVARAFSLVGALSIVRFRTPVKEPEELAYLFLAITVGLGMGAGLRVVTVVATALIVGLVTLVQWRARRTSTRNLFLNLGVEVPDGEPTAHALRPLHEILRRHCRQVDLRRMDAERERLELTFFVDVPHVQALDGLANELEQHYPTIRVTLLDQGRLPSL